MADLSDGESVEMQGSAARPYVLKNVGGVYSCTCPAWRNQSLPIERRTCKHLRRWRGDMAEAERIGAALPAQALSPAPAVVAPGLLLAETWDSQADPSDWLMSEKLDGVRCYWNGSIFLSRQGHRYYAPAWFTAGLPEAPLDGELWIDRKQFQRTVSIVRRHDATDQWRAVRFVVFDAPAILKPFEERLRFVREALPRTDDAHAIPLAHFRCTGADHLQSYLAQVEELGGEGVMLRKPGSLYVAGRSATLIKVKRFHDAEAHVIGHQPGRGRHKGRLGALLVQLADGTRFAVGSGLSDAEREQPPAIGSLITFKFQELSDGGVPRFPTYVGVRADAGQPTNLTTKGDENMATVSNATRRFEFVGGGSDKFYEVTVNGVKVTVCFGRNGTQGQTQTKTFADEAAAEKHAASLVKQKVGKGYVETV